MGTQSIPDRAERNRFCPMQLHVSHRGGHRPVTFLLDRERRILWRAIGTREWDTPPVRAYLERRLGAP